MAVAGYLGAFLFSSFSFCPRVIPSARRDLNEPGHRPLQCVRRGAVYGLSADANQQILIDAAGARPTRQALLLRRRCEHRQVVALGAELVVRSSQSAPYTAEMNVEQGPERAPATFGTLGSTTRAGLSAQKVNSLLH